MDRGEILYRGGGQLLTGSEDALFLRDGERVYELTSHPYEPCLYLRERGSLAAVLHNGFGTEDVCRAARQGETLRSVTGNEFGVGRLCRLLAFAASRGLEADVGYAEGKLALEDLKARGAFSPETAVKPEELGLRRIDERLTRSKKLTERVMHTEDGRVYVRSKG